MTAKPVLWTEGMLLTPQHLQQHDRYLEALVSVQLGLARAHAWGVAELELDAVALSAGQLKLVRFAGIWPDGTALRLSPGSDELPPPRPVTLSDSGACETAYLALASHRPGRSNVADEGAAARGARYIRQTRSFRDSATGDGEVPVELGRRNLRLLLDRDERDGYDCLPIAQLVLGDGGELALCQPFVPPCLRVGASPFLLESLRGLLAKAIAKQQAVAEERRQREGSSAEFAARDVTRFLMLHTLNEFIPLAADMLDNPSASPHALYTLLARTAGQLCSFSTDADPAKLPVYRHAALRETFEPLVAKLNQLLGTTLLQECIRVPLEAREDGVHLARLDDERLLRPQTRFIVDIASALPEEQTATLAVSRGKCASWTEISEVVSSATRGVPLSRLSRPPAAVPAKNGHVYLAVDERDELWQAVLKERTIAVHLPAPFRPADTTTALLAVPAAG